MPFTQRHLLGLEGLPAEEILHVLDTAEPSSRSGSATSRRCRRCAARPSINLFFEASTRTRTSFEIAAQAPVGRRGQHLGLGLERQKGETLARHGAQPRGMRPDVDRRAPRRRRAPPHFLARAVDASRRSTPATARTSTRRRRCSTLHDPRAARAGSHGLKVAIVGDILHSRVARSNSGPAPSSARRCGCAGRPRCCRAEVERLRRRGLRPRSSEAIDGRRRGHDAAHPARAAGGGLFPIAPRVRALFGLDRASAGAAPSRTRSSCTPAR